MYGRFPLPETAHRFYIESIALSALPDRVPLLPVPGEYEHPAYGVMTITPDRIAQFVANHNARIYQQHIPIDAEHETKLSGALGYLGDAQIEADGSATASVEWTARGETLVGGGGFRYVSPEWYETWTDPAAGATYNDVLIGLAITTRPFFKESALPPLVAREHGRVPPTAGGDDADATTTTTASVTTGETPPMELTEEKVNDLVSQKLTEQAQTFGEQIRTLTERLTATEAENVRLTNETRIKAFRDEVMGRSDANGTRWFGDIEQHVKILDALDDDTRAAYIETQRELAKTVTESGAFSEIGSGHGDTEKSALAEIEQKARTYSEANGVTYAQAFDHVLQTDSALRSRYAQER